jgi:hypothetical protein
MLTWWKGPFNEPEKRDRLVLSEFVALYLVQMHFFPMACARYLLPLFPCVIALMLHSMRYLGARERRWWEVSNLVSVLVLSVCLSVADHLIVNADRNLPAELIRRGCDPSRTWYFGRLSFDYYLYHNGFQNACTSDSVPRSGDFAVEESIPSDYPLRMYLADSLALETVDTLRYHRFPVRTRRPYGGFYGESRIPYYLDWRSPLREYVLFRVRK